MNILLSAGQEADRENVGTIKIRHLSTVASSSPTINQTQQQNLDEGSDVHGTTKETISTLSNVNIKNILKQFQVKRWRMMPLKRYFFCITIMLRT